MLLFHSGLHYIICLNLFFFIIYIICYFVVCMHTDAFVFQIGAPLRMCHITRPWEEPHDIEELQKSGGIKPSRLVEGSSVDDYVMIPNPNVRRSLHALTYGKKGKAPAAKYSVDQQSGDLIKS